MEDASGLVLPRRARLVHGEGAIVRRPFPDMPLAMHELDGGSSQGERAFHGPFGFIPFTADLRLPRHVHLGQGGNNTNLLPERILVLEGTALVELNGDIIVVPPRSLVDIEPGVPHCWTACPAGARLPDGSVTDGRFLMVYSYAAPTAFAPLASTVTLRSAAEYRPFNGDLATIQFPAMTLDAVIARTSLLWHRSLGEHALTKA